MKNIIYLFIFFLSLNVFAQKEANNWFFGIGAGIHFQDDGTVNAVTGSPIVTNEGCSTISDKSGNLLFYTDGRNVWDRNHVLMPNGNYDQNTGLMGDPSSTQSAIIIPKIGDNNIYYIFTVDEPHHENAAVYPLKFTGPYEDGGTIPTDDDGFNNGLNYSVVDLSITGANGSIGDITSRNNHLVTYDPLNAEEIKYKCSEKVTATKNSTGTGYWVITHFVDKFYAFKVTSNGVNTTPIVTGINPVVPTFGYRKNAIGCLKISANGKKIAVAHQQVTTSLEDTENNGVVMLYDFNSTTGVVSNAIVISQNTIPYGVEFSQKSRKLYVSYENQGGFGGLHQYNLLNEDIPGSDIPLGNTTQSGALQMGPNGKIYRAVVSTAFLDVINNPEEDGALCNFVKNQQPLGVPKSFFGLPSFVTSYFSAAIISRKKCLNDITEFELNTDDVFETAEWDFGDGTPLTIPSPNIGSTHQYATAGDYTVVAKLTHQGEVFYVNTVITIAAVPVVNTPNEITACDPDNDGITVFDLSQNTAVILGNQNSAAVNVKYFNSLQDADNNTAELNAKAYTNSNSIETIYARIQNSATPECYQTTYFIIRALKSPVVDAVAQKIICLNDADGLVLDAISFNAEQYTYMWSTGQTFNTITIHNPGSYSVTITNSLGCSKLKTFIVVPSDAAIIKDVIIRDMLENNTVTVIAVPPAGVVTQYVYALDDPNGTFQESNLFENVVSGVHTVYVKDVQGCGISYKEISVLSIPKFFTPNGDGTNDTWNIIGINTFFYPDSNIYIFDRYGKLLANVDPKGIGWDGNLDGQRLPADDYWYVIELDNGRTVKGHFSLIR